MKQICIAATTASLLATRAIFPFVDNSINNGDGTVTIPVDNDVYSKLKEISDDMDVAVLYLLNKEFN